MRPSSARAYTGVPALAFRVSGRKALGHVKEQNGRVMTNRGRQAFWDFEALFKLALSWRIGDREIG